MLRHLTGIAVMALLPQRMADAGLVLPEARPGQD